MSSGRSAFLASRSGAERSSLGHRLRVGHPIFVPKFFG